MAEADTGLCVFASRELTFNMVGRVCFLRPRGQVFFSCFFSLLALGFGEWGFSI